MSQSLSAVYAHAVFSTKERWPFLRDRNVRAQMHAFLSTESNRLGCPTIITGGTEDHVHQLFRLNRVMSQADWIKEIKRVSSLWVKSLDIKLHKFSWQSGYGMFSVSQSEIVYLSRYIENQEEHHRKVSFQDEFRLMLEQHGLEWDERYVWD